MRVELFKNRRTLALWVTLGILAAIILLSGWCLRGGARTLAAQKCAVDMVEISSQSADASAFTPRSEAVIQKAIELLPQKLIRNAKLSLEIQHYDHFEANLRALTQRYGYLSNIRVNQDERGVRRAEITLRVEPSRFEAALDSFKRLGSVKHEEISVEDVTRSYADLEARFANKRASAARLREIIQTRTGKLSEVIEAEQALSEITEQMESMEAQKRTMDQQLAYSTIQAEVHEPSASITAPPVKLWLPITEALKEARSALIGSLAFLLAALTVLLPWALLILGITILWRRIRKQKKEAEEL